MTNTCETRVITTGEFYRIISSVDQDERALLIGADLRSVEFTKPIHIWGLNLSHTNLDSADFYQALLDRCDLSKASLKGTELEKAVFTKVNLTNTDLTESHLISAQFKASLLVNTNFIQANLEGADFDGLRVGGREKNIIKNTNFEGAILRKANLRGYSASEPLDLSTANLKNADLKGVLYDSYTRFPGGFDPKVAGAYLITPGVCLAGSDLSFTNLYKARLSGANLSKCNLTGTRLHSADLSGANLTGATIVYENGRADIDLYANVHLDGAILRQAKIIGINPHNALTWMNGVDLTEAQIINCGFTCAEMNGAKLANLRLDGMKFYGSKLNGTDFSNASLRGCNLDNTELRGANLKGADLSGASLKFANLTGTDLSETKLDGANLMNAKLEGAKIPG